MTNTLVIPDLCLRGPNGHPDRWTTARIRDSVHNALFHSLMHSQTLSIPPLPLVVTITRVGPGHVENGARVGLDDDNVHGAVKPVRDEVACWVGVKVRAMRQGQRRGVADDRDPRVTWRAEQRIGDGYAVEIRFERRSE